MSKVTDLLDAVVGVISNVRNLADSLQNVADILSEFKSEEVVKSKSVLQISDKTEKSAKEKTYTLEDVRGVLAEKSQSGLTSEVKKLIAKYGGNKLSDIDSSKYEAIIKEANMLEKG